jgi:hypothetical protein
MRTQSYASAGSRSAVWVERKQDALMVSAFGAWALMLGIGPLLAFRALLP